MLTVRIVRDIVLINAAGMHAEVRRTLARCHTTSLEPDASPAAPSSSHASLQCTQPRAANHHPPPAPPHCSAQFYLEVRPAAHRGAAVVVEANDVTL